MQLAKYKPVGIAAVNAIFLICLNIAMMSIIGYLTLDSNANLNSRVGGAFISFLLPMFIVAQTRSMGDIERLLKFGGGFIVYLLLSLFLVGVPIAFVSWLMPCLILASATLFYGNRFNA